MQNEDNEAVESDRRMAGTFLRLIAISLPIAGIVWFLLSGRDQTANPASPVTIATTPDAKPTPAAPPPAPEAVTPVPAVPATAAPADLLTVAFAARRPCWISATVDGQKKIERLVQPGEQQTIEVHREMVLTAGDATAITVTLNGADAKPLGRSGEVVTVRFTLANFRDYLTNR